MLTALTFAAIVATSPVSEDITVAAEPAPLHGTLLTADDARAAAVILPGSGPTDRDGNSPLGVTSSNLRLLAEALAEQGVTTVRIDKRGIAASAQAGLSEADLRFDHMVADARLWVDDLVTRTGRPCVWIIGHSEGALVGQLAAVDNPKVCGLVLASGAGRPAADILRDQVLPQLVGPNAILLEPTKVALDALEAGQLTDPVPGLDSLFRPSVQPYMISWMRFDPAVLARDYAGPILVVHGTTDLQTTQVEADALGNARPGIERVDIEGMNHVMKIAPADPTANIATYSQPDLPLAPGVADAIAAFIVRER